MADKHPHMERHLDRHDNVTLSEALSGILSAAVYCDRQGLDTLAKDLADLYQQVGQAAPTDDWDRNGDESEVGPLLTGGPPSQD